jgi:hypothetical protein
MSSQCDRFALRFWRIGTAALAACLLGLLAPQALAGKVTSCGCTWENGSPAFVSPTSLTGVVSHEGGDITLGFKSADDFYLEPGYIHRLTSISADMLTSSFTGFAKARLELYADCDGRPGALLQTFTKSRVAEGAPVGFDGLRRVRFTFLADEQGLPNTVNPPIGLRGGTYWVSIVGVTDGLCPMGMCDKTFWLAADSPVKGKVAHKLSGVQSMTPGVFSYAGQSWQPVDECCAGCIDLSFTVCTESCKILLDNGGPDLTRFSKSLSGPPLIVEARTADDFVIPPCVDQQVCYVQGYIATNCNPPRARLDIYDAACHLPATFNPPIMFPMSRITPTGDVITVNGETLPVYSVEFWDFRVNNTPEILTLPAGLNYWMSIYALATGSLTEKGYVLGAKRCNLPNCSPAFKRFNPAAVSGFAFGIQDYSWRPVDPIGGDTYDLGFTIATRPAIPFDPNSASPQACTPDTNRDGTLTIDDMFQYIAQWFVGCP